MDKIIITEVLEQHYQGKNGRDYAYVEASNGSKYYVEQYTVLRKVGDDITYVEKKMQGIRFKLLTDEVYIEDVPVTILMWSIIIGFMFGVYYLTEKLF
jgi:hypothetical protein